MNDPMDTSPDSTVGPPTAVPPLVNFGDQRLPAIRAGHRRVRAPASNAGTVGPGLVSWIQLDTSQLGAFLDPHYSYLEFNLKMKNFIHNSANPNGNKMTAALLSNCGVAGFIDTFRIYVQGNCVEEIQNYGAAQELLMDINGNGQYMFDPPIVGGGDWKDGVQAAVGPPAVGTIDQNAAAPYEVTAVTSALNLSAGQTFPYSISPYDYKDPGLNGGKLRGATPQLGQKLGRPRTFDSLLLHQNRFITSAGSPQTVGDNAYTKDSIDLRCCVPLISSFLGMFATKAFPLLDFAPGSVQIQITWAQQFAPFYGLLLNVDQTSTGVDANNILSFNAKFPAAPTNGADADLNRITWEISEINFVHKVIVMPAEVAGVIMSRQAQSATTLRVRQLRYYILPRLSTNASTYNLIVPAKIQSASAMYLAFRTENTNVPNKFSYCRYNPGFRAHSGAIKVQTRIGSEYVPTQAITTGPELFAETIKAMNKLSTTDGETLLDDVHYFGGINTAYNAGNIFGANNATANSADYHNLYMNKGCNFVIGIDFDAFSGSTDTTRSGMYLGNNTMTVELQLSRNPTENHTVDGWFLHDSELVIKETGVAILYY